MKENAWHMLKSSLCMHRSLVLDDCHSLVPVPKRSGILRIWTVHKKMDHIAEKMLLEFAERTCPIFRATTPVSRGQLRSKDMENCPFTIVPTRQRLRFFSNNCFCKSAQSLRSSREHV